MSDLTTNEPTKQCIKCDKLLPATAEYFHRHKTARDGLRSDCKNCNGERKRKWDKENAERRKESERLWRERNAEQQRIYRRKWYEDNREIRTEYNKQYRERNLEHLRAYDRERSKSPTRKAWRSAYRKRRPDVFSRIAAQDYKRHRAKYKMWSHAYESRKRNLPADLTPEQWQFALDYFGGCCAYCGKHPGLFDVLCVEHYVPMSSPDCEGTTVTNCVPACHGLSGCNNSKRNKDPETWVITAFGKRKGRKILKRIADYFATVRSAKG